MTPEEYFNIIANNRSITTQGIGVSDGSKETLDDERGNLAGCYDEANACKEFLKTCRRTNKPNKAAGSTKDILYAVERATGLKNIPEGALILAALHLGFKMKRVRNRTSVYLNIKEKKNDTKGI